MSGCYYNAYVHIHAWNMFATLLPVTTDAGPMRVVQIVSNAASDSTTAR